MEKLNAARIESLPKLLDCSRFLDAMLNKQFVVFHDLRGGTTSLLFEGSGPLSALPNCVTGIGLEEISPDCMPRFEDLAYFTVFNPLKEDAFASIYRALEGRCDSFMVVFSPVTKEYVEETKLRAERAMSSKGVRLTRSFGDRSSPMHSMQSELYYGSDERKALIDMLDSLGNSMLANGTAYKVGIILSKPGNGTLCDYLRSKLLIISEDRMRATDARSVFEEAKRINSVPLDTAHAFLFLTFSDSIRRVPVVGSGVAVSSGSIVLGSHLEGGVSARKPVSIERSTLNLGCVVTGLQGTGKTFAAMGIVDQVIATGTKAVVIAPTDEWNQFGRQHGMHVISLYRSLVPINFFKCDAGINVERFYENLATLMAAASSAGPYTRSLEKVLLAAFHRAYKHTKSPDPVCVYDEIENAIIEQHAKRTNAGADYTKHGENVRAALQSIRLMLMRPEFACTDGIDFRGLIESGAVFDLSNVSTSMRAFFYALILNQVYTISDTFGNDGDRELRLILCIEEAQLALQEDEQTAASADLRQRIQDFRKKGIGLMLITHSVTDIVQGVRRLCQTKLYFRQSADVARYASNDLIFCEEQKPDVMDRLKALGHRVCAINYIYSSGSGKDFADSIFVRVPEYAQSSPAAARLDDIEDKGLREAAMRIRLVNPDNSPRAGANVEVFYVGERIFRGTTDPSGTAVVEGTIKGKRYTVSVLGDRKRDTRRFDATGGRGNEILL